MAQQYEPTNDPTPQGGTGSPWAPPAAPPAPPAPGVRTARRGGIGAGVVLIAVGAIFLAGQVVPGLMWWNLWPLLIVLVGVIQMFTPGYHEDWAPERILDGLGTVVLGAVLLGNTMGIVSWGVWWTFITLWPVLIIALGVSILGRGMRIGALRAIAPFIVWGALAYSVAASFTGVGGFQPIPQIVRPSVAGEAFSYDEAVNGATAASLDFKGGAGDITLKGGTSLLSATGASPWGKPTVTVNRGTAGAAVAFSMGSSDHMVVVPGISTSKADVRLAEGVVWDVTLETGACNLTADFSAVQVKKLLLKTGASNATLKFGQVPAASSSTDVAIKAGVSNIEILVPSDVAVKLDAHNGLSGTDVDSRLRSTAAGVWESPDYASASKTLNISVESGVSSISLRTY